MMHLNLLLLGALQLSSVFAAPPAPQKRRAPTLPTQLNTDPHCTSWYDNHGDIECRDLPRALDVSMGEFLRLNPTISTSCTNFLPGMSYCIHAAKRTVPRQALATVATSLAATPRPSGQLHPPGLVQPDQTPTCNRWDYVNSGDICNTFINLHPELTVRNLMEWNPSIGTECQNMWLGTYLCTGATGAAIPHPSVVPGSMQRGTLANCSRYYKVQHGDYCESIARYFEISLQTFYVSNPGTGIGCNALMPSRYVCVAN